MTNEFRVIATTVLSLILIKLIDPTSGPSWHLFVFPCIYYILGTPQIVELFNSFGIPNPGGRTNNTRQSIRGRYLIPANDLELKPSRPQPLGAQYDLWKLVPQRDQSSFPVVAELSIPEAYTGDKKMEIKGKVQWRELLQETNYAAFLIFKTKQNSTGLNNLQESSINSMGSQLTRKKIVSINPTNIVRPRDRSIGLPKVRVPVDANGWMEMELGKFYRDFEPGHEEVIILKDYSNENKTGLIVAGIQLRPI